MEELFYGIGMCEFINAVLVQGGIRNGMLIQYIYYKEYSASDNITKNQIVKTLLKIMFKQTNFIIFYVISPMIKLRIPNKR